MPAIQTTPVVFTRPVNQTYSQGDGRERSVLQSATYGDLPPAHSSCQVHVLPSFGPRGAGTVWQLRACGGGVSRSLPSPCRVPWMHAQHFFSSYCNHQTLSLLHVDRMRKERSSDGQAAGAARAPQNVQKLFSVCGGSAGF